MFCTKCGTQLAQNAAFCNNCGNKQEQVAQAPQQQPPQQPQTGQAPQQFNQQPIYGHATAKIPGQTGVKVTGILLIVLGGLMLLGLPAWPSLVHDAYRAVHGWGWFLNPPEFTIMHWAFAITNIGYIIALGIYGVVYSKRADKAVSIRSGCIGLMVDTALTHFVIYMLVSMEYALLMALIMTAIKTPILIPMMVSATKSAKSA